MTRSEQIAEARSELDRVILLLARLGERVAKIRDDLHDLR